MNGGQDDNGENFAKSPPKPAIDDAALQHIINGIYYANPIIGKTLADTARYERLTGDSIKGRNHIKKAQQYLKSLENWLLKRANRDSQNRIIAITLYNDLADALDVDEWQDDKE